MASSVRWSFGGPVEERLQMNEDTLWSGAPKEWNNPEAKTHLAEVARLVLKEKATTLGHQWGCAGRCKALTRSRICRSATYTCVADGRSGQTTTGAISISTPLSHGVSYAAAMPVSAPARSFERTEQMIVIRLELRPVWADDVWRKHGQPADAHTSACGRAALALTGECAAHVDPSYLVKTWEPVVCTAEADGAE